MRMISLLGALLISASPADMAAASSDRQQFRQEDWGYIYYLSCSGEDEASEQQLAAVARFVASSFSRQPILERSTPVPVAGTALLRLDLRELDWSWRDWHRVLERYPYYPPAKLPLVVRADWLVVELTDNFASDSGYRLLYGAQNIPATRDEFLEFWQVIDDRRSNFGLIEAQSGVSKQRYRWIESRPVPRGYAWGTRDVLRVAEGRDLLEFPDGSFRHDGEEWIVGIPKVSLAEGTRGVLQVYLLAAGDGKRVDRAPVDLVEDHGRFRGLAEIRNTGSCIGCHTSGLNYPTENALRSLIVDGVDLYAGKKVQEQLELFHLTDVGKELTRNIEDYEAIVRLCSGLPAAELVAAFKSAVDAYDADVTLAVAARELHTTPRELKLALAYVSAGEQGARLSWLAHGRAMARETWESLYGRAYYALRAWKAGGNSASASATGDQE